MATHFADKLVLARWALKQVGSDNFDRLSLWLRVRAALEQLERLTQKDSSCRRESLYY